MRWQDAGGPRFGVVLLGGELFFYGGDGGELLLAVGEALLLGGVGFDEAGARSCQGSAISYQILA